MKRRGDKARRAIGAWVLVVALAWPVSCALAEEPGLAEATTDDAAGREYFERGKRAFEAADYETALVYFRHAYQLSRRAELQYNIGLTADRLQREEEALDAFERYLEEAQDPTREAEAHERIEALRRSIAEREATELALKEATARFQEAGAEPIDGRRLAKSSVIGASTLAAVGAAGVAAMSVGLSKNGRCKEESAGNCVVEQSATAWTWVYGGVGIAALTGSAVWFAVAARRARRGRETKMSLGPTGISVSGTF